MKLPALLLAGSLAANAALLLVFLTRPPAAPAPTASLTTAPPSLNSHPSALNSASTLPPGLTPRTWSTLDTPDLRELVARLRATGFSPRVIRAIIETRIYENYTAFYLGRLPPLGDVPYWKASREIFPGYDQVFPELILFWRRQNPIREELVAAISPEEAAAQRRRDFGNLPREKIAGVKRINEDYGDLRRQVGTASQGVMLSSDRAQLDLLEREKQADLAALLSPAELAEYELATTPVSYGLRRAFTVMDATEAEFRSIAPYLKSLNSEGQDPATEAAAAVQIKTALGDARYAEFVRTSDREFQQLTYLGQQASLPATTALQALAVRDTAVQESNRIARDATLTYDQKRAALAALALNTRTQLTITLGPTAAPTYLTFASKWLTGLESGGSVSFTPSKPVITPLPKPGT